MAVAALGIFVGADRFKRSRYSLRRRQEAHRPTTFRSGTHRTPASNGNTITVPGGEFGVGI
jgi:hypothetical protein